MISKRDKGAKRVARQKRVRAKVKGTAERPRLSVYKSLTNIYAQIIDDTTGTTILAVSTLNDEVKNKTSNIESAKEVGTLIAKKAVEKKIDTVVFDRNGYLYHGKVAALAEAAREVGLKF